jgi:hypothetical protein
MTIYGTLTEALRKLLEDNRRSYSETGEYPETYIHRDLDGEPHTDDPECWCEPLHLTEKDQWLEWTPEELAERLRGGVS